MQLVLVQSARDNAIWHNYRRTSPPEADKGLIPRPLGRLRWFPIDTPLLAAGKFIKPKAKPKFFS
ncbi:MAG: hypothetical protein DRH11_14155 [Deltaproteobacteria bacterium]|nr:MAG: hypothetical protein DRH11_14155 [Deltaproteobacteria bacterium]